MKRLQLIILFIFLFSFAYAKENNEKSIKNNKIKIGVLAPKNIYLGKMVMKATRLAADEINAMGGILGRKIKLIFKDTEYKADISRLRLIEALNKDKVDFIVGGVNSSVVLTAMEIMSDHKKIWLGTGGSSPKVVDKVKKNYERYKYYFRVGTMGALAQGKECANFLINYLTPKFGDKVKKIALIGSDHAYSHFIIGQTKNALRKTGKYEIVFEKKLPPNTTDFSPEIDELKKSGANVVIQAWLSIDSISFTKQFYHEKVPAILIGGVVRSLKDEYSIETKGASAYSLNFSPQSGPTPMTRKTLKFSKAFQKRFMESAGSYAYPAYDTLYILKTAIEKARGFNSDKLVKILESMEYEGNIWYKFKSDNHDIKMGIENKKVYANNIWFQWQPVDFHETIPPIFIQTGPLNLFTFLKI